MPRPPVLTLDQKNRLHILEPALRKAVRLGDYNSARRITGEIQVVLRASGHETRLMQAKAWLFESAMEAGELDIAESGFVGIRRKRRVELVHISKQRHCSLSAIFERID